MMRKRKRRWMRMKDIQTANRRHELRRTKEQKRKNEKTKRQKKEY